jgi:hypothetical protein
MAYCLLFVGDSMVAIKVEPPDEHFDHVALILADGGTGRCAGHVLY